MDAPAPDPLLVTKFFAPAARPDLVERPRLVERLSAGLSGPLTLIAAPAGSGKTSLVSAWIHSPPAAAYRSAWLALDPDDDEPIRFLRYLIAALDRLVPGSGAASAALAQSPQPLAPRVVLTPLLNALAERAEPVVLFVDDYQVITLPRIHEIVSYLIEHGPPELHVVLLSRSDPPLNLARLRATGALCEIRAADLRFVRGEIDALINGIARLDLDPESLDLLEARTEGWATGLRMAALALQDEPDRRGFVRAFSASHRFLTDYLLDEVLAQQAPELRHFLLHTSILSRLQADLCDVVAGVENGAEQLRRLEAIGLFITPLDGERRWFRYHRLFAQFLELRLKSTRPEAIPDLYRRAARWSADHGQTRDATAYALSAGDTALAADLIEQRAPDVIAAEGATPILSWISALPEPVVRARPILASHLAWAQTNTGRMTEAGKSLDAAEAALTGSSDDSKTRMARGQIAAHRAYLLFFQGDYLAAIAQARAAIATLPDDAILLRARTLDVLGLGLRYAGDVPGAFAAHAASATLCRRSDSIVAAVFNFASLAQLQRECGQLRKALQTYGQALDFARRHAGRPDLAFTGFAYLGQGAILREHNQLEAAAASVQRGIELCRDAQQADLLAIALMEQAFVFRDRADYDRAYRALGEARQIVADAASEWGVTMVDALVAQVDLARGDVSAARRWAETCGWSITDEPRFERGDITRALVGVALETGNDSQALRSLDQELAAFRKAGRTARVLDAQIWRARALAGLGQTEAARAALAEAVSLGAADGFVRSFVNGGPVIGRLLGDLPAGAYRDALRSAFAPAPGVPAPNTGPETLLEALNERELEILALMATGKANQEIGAHLYLSVNTIRWYASQIYLKLQVKNRGEAVARARTLGLL